MFGLYDIKSSFQARQRRSEWPTVSTGRRTFPLDSVQIIAVFLTTYSPSLLSGHPEVRVSENEATQQDLSEVESVQLTRC